VANLSLTHRPRFPTLAFLRALIRTNLRAAFALRAAFWLQVVLMALNNWVFFSFWWLLFRKVPTLGGWQLGDVAVLFGVSACGFGLGVFFAGGVRKLGRSIESGELDALLTQPKPTLLYTLGSHSIVPGLGDIASGLILIVLSGKASLSSVPFIALAIVSSALVYIASGTLFFSAQFWFRQTDTVATKMWEALITFSLYPEPLFGGGLRLLLFTLIPAGFVSYIPAALVREPSATALLSVAVGPLLYWSLAAYVFRRGLMRYSSGNRFGSFGS